MNRISPAVLAELRDGLTTDRARELYGQLCDAYDAAVECAEQAMGEGFATGWRSACDQIELRLRRHFSRLYPHDVNAAAICQATKASLEALEEKP